MLWNVRVKTLPGTVVNFSHMHWKLPKTFWPILTNFDLLGMIKINLYAPNKGGEGDQKLLIPCPYIFENLKYWIRYNFFKRSFIYCKCIIFSVYDTWRTSNFLLFSVDLFWWLNEIHLLSLYKCPFSDVHYLAEIFNRQRH